MSEQKYRPDGRPDNEDSMNTPFGKFVTALAFFFIIGPIYLVLQAMGGCRWIELKNHIVNERVDVLILHENTNGEGREKVEEKIVAACKGLWDEGKPVVKLDNPETESFAASSREWFAVDQSRYRGPGVAPAYIQRRTRSGESSFDVIYAAFKTDAFNQARAWLKANGYSEADIRIEFPDSEPEFFDKGSVEMYHEVVPRRGESVIQFQGIFYVSMGDTWSWNGRSVFEVADDLRAFSKLVRKVAK